MTEIPKDDFEAGKILFAEKPNGENMTKHYQSHNQGLNDK